MSSDNPQDGEAKALDVETGRITCGSVERRRLYEQLGLEGRVEFIGDAAKAGRQAEEGEHREREASGESAEKDADPYEEAYL